MTLMPKAFNPIKPLSLILLMGLLLSGLFVWAQQEAAPQELQDPPQSAIDRESNPTPEVETDEEFNRFRRYLTLTIGIEHEETITGLPKTINLKGDFKKVTSVTRATSGNILRFSPRSVGVATLTIHDSTGKMIGEYRIDVKKSTLDKVAREIRSLIGDIEGIQIKVLNNKVVVDGQILLPRDMSRIGNVILQYPDQAVSLVTLSPVAQKKIAEIIEREINNPEVNVRAINDKFILEGFVNSKDESTRAESIARLYIPDIILDPAEEKFVKKRKSPDVVINLIEVKPPPEKQPGKIIQVVVHYVELSKNYEKGFRFQWMPTIQDDSSLTISSGSQGGGGFATTLTGTINSLFPKLNWAKRHGHARVLQSQSLIVEEGKKGDLDSNTGVPYQVIDSNGTSGTQFETVGIKTSVTPTLIGQRSDSIQLEMSFQVGSLVDITTAGPIVSKNNLNTSITVRSGQSAAIGGLITNTSNTGYNRLPTGVSDNPLISLYASKDFLRKQSQFVVFVTPIIKSSASSGSERIKQKFKLRE